MWNHHDTSDKARCLRSCILNLEFILSLVILNKGFALGLALSKCLQTTSIDLKEAMALAKNTKQELEEIRINADTYFREIFEQVKLMTAQFDIEIKIPRIAKRQTNRCNIEVDNAETLYRISVFIPYLDKYINELENRFTITTLHCQVSILYLKKMGMMKILLILQGSIVKIWRTLEIVKRYLKMNLNFGKENSKIYRNWSS